MKGRVWKVLGLAFIVSSLSFGLSAEVLLKDNSEISGKWLLESVAPGLTKAKIVENRTWEFTKAGKLITSGFNRHFGKEDVQEFTYEVVEGKIKTDNPGRPGKTLDYAVYEKIDDRMILQGGLEGFYFLKKQ